MAEDTKTLEEVILTRLLRLNATAQGVVTGLLVGLAVFLVTNWLIIKGGPTGSEGEPIVGPHLSLLSQFFIGYDVTFVGSLVGFAYAFFGGFIGGYFVARVYNWVVDFKGVERGHHA